MNAITIGFSPCPNDTFIFHALVHGLVETGGLAFEPRLEDVETLNRRALARELDVTKVSYGALPYLLDDYALLRSGGALGRGCGPLLVARDSPIIDPLPRARIAIPGHMTTANLLLRLFEPDARPGIEMSYDEIMPAVARGEVDAGLIIHESRFTYQEHGLVAIVDLGEWWERTTGAPIPLGGIVARRELRQDIPLIDRAIRESVEYAFAHPDASADFVERHAQELSDTVRRSHISLYVNASSIDVGAEGELAVGQLMHRARTAGLLPEREVDPFSATGAI